MPKPKTFAYADVDSAGTIYSYPNGPDNTIGNGNPTGGQFQDSDDMYTMQGFNVINSTDDDYAGKSSGATWQRTAVRVDIADRGRES